MVLENIIGVTRAKRNPLLLFFSTAIIASVGMWISFFVFPESASILSLAFVTIAFSPFVHKLFYVETKEFEDPKWHSSFLTRHLGVIEIYAVIFVAMMFTYGFWFAMLPTASTDCTGEDRSINCALPTRDAIFSEQKKVYKAITGVEATGNLTATGRAIGEKECKTPGESTIEKCTAFIFMNNSIVLGLATLFSFLYGAGAIFLIGWNASVIGTFIGAEALQKNLFAGLGRAIGYVPHGIWEIGGYFIGAIAGGIITAALARKQYTAKQFEVVAKDALLLIFFAYFTLLIGSMLEATLIIHPALAELLIIGEAVFFFLVIILYFLLKKR